MAHSSKKLSNPETTGNSGDPQLAVPAWPMTLARWNMEIATLYAKRLQEWSMLPMQCMRCTSPEALSQAQAEFSRNLIADYSLAAERLARAVGAGEGNYAASLLRAQEDARDIIDQAKAQAERIIAEAEARGAGAQTKAA